MYTAYTADMQKDLFLKFSLSLFALKNGLRNYLAREKGATSCKLCW